MLTLVERHWLWLALGASAAMLATAHAFERFGGLAPCHLCLEQRTAYWVAIAVCLLGLAIQRVEQLRPWILGGLALVLLAGAAVAIQQAGAEWKFWPAPEGCSGARAATAADLARLLSNKPMATPRCDEAAWRMLGLSMAGWNALVSLGLAAMSGLAAVRKPV
jgi:disulfide bond formation protein DsbB